MLGGCHYSLSSSWSDPVQRVNHAIAVGQSSRTWQAGSHQVTLLSSLSLKGATSFATHQPWDKLLLFWAFMFIVVNHLFMIRITPSHARNCTYHKKLAAWSQLEGAYHWGQNSEGEDGGRERVTVARRWGVFASFHVCPVFYLWYLRVLFCIGICGEADTGKRKGGFVYAIHIWCFAIMHFNNYLNKLLKLAFHFILGSLEAFCLLNTLEVFTALGKWFITIDLYGTQYKLHGSGCRNYGSSRTTSPTIETETSLINRRVESEMDRFIQFDDLSH